MYCMLQNVQLDLSPRAFNGESRRNIPTKNGQQNTWSWGMKCMRNSKVSNSGVKIEPEKIHLWQIPEEINVKIFKRPDIFSEILRPCKLLDMNKILKLSMANTRLKSAQRPSRNIKLSILTKSKLIVNSPWVEHLCHSCRKGSRSVKWGQTDRWRRSGAVSRGGQRLQRLASSPSHTHS